MKEKNFVETKNVNEIVELLKDAKEFIDAGTLLTRINKCDGRDIIIHPIKSEIKNTLLVVIKESDGTFKYKEVITKKSVEEFLEYVKRRYQPSPQPANVEIKEVSAVETKNETQC